MQEGGAMRMWFDLNVILIWHGIYTRYTLIFMNVSASFRIRLSFASGEALWWCVVVTLWRCGFVSLYCYQEIRGEQAALLLLLLLAGWLAVSPRKLVHKEFHP